MTLTVWLAFCVTEVVLCFTPGPAVLLVVAVALSRGRAAGFASASGILLANTGYFALSATGLAALLITSNVLFNAVKWAGGAYLIWLGLRMLWVARDTASAEPMVVKDAFLRGFVVQAASPKTLVFFVALLPQFIDPTGVLGTQLIVLGVSSVLIEFLALATFIGASARARDLFGARLESLVQRLSGVCLLFAGARLALDRSR